MSRVSSRTRAAASYGVVTTDIGPLFIAVASNRLLSVRFGIDETRAAEAAVDVEHETRGA